MRQRPAWHFDPGTGKRLLCEQLGTRDLAGFDAEDALAAVGAAGCLLQYVKDTQRGSLPHIRALHRERREQAVLIDAQTRSNLELEASLGARAGAHARRPHGPLLHRDGQPASAPLAESADSRSCVS